MAFFFSVMHLGSNVSGKYCLHQYVAFSSSYPDSTKG